eukprot:scaffold7095_cov260-Pinguiococcus_pyrenoidosus.AAC.14
MIGSFQQPKCVLIDTDALDSLPDRELASGVAEIIKYGLIYDAQLFEWLEENVEKLLARDKEAMAYAIKRSCEIKADIVAQDEKEAGIRATLNLGHTFGHAIELGLGYGAWLHGEAVGLGMAMASDFSLKQGWITQELRDRAFALIERAKLPTTLPENHGLTPEGFKSAMSRDKKRAALQNDVPSKRTRNGPGALKHRPGRSHPRLHGALQEFIDVRRCALSLQGRPLAFREVVQQLRNGPGNQRIARTAHILHAVDSLGGQQMKADALKVEVLLGTCSRVCCKDCTSGSAGADHELHSAQLVRGTGITPRPSRIAEAGEQGPRGFVHFAMRKASQNAFAP